MDHKTAFKLLKKIAPAVEGDALTFGLSPEEARELAEWMRNPCEAWGCLDVPVSSALGATTSECVMCGRYFANY